MRQPQPRYSEVFESLATSSHPQVRANVAPFIDRLLGRGFVHAEEIVWSKLLQDEAPDVASQVGEYLWLHLQENPRLYDAEELHLRLMDALNAGLPAPSRYTRSPATAE